MPSLDSIVFKNKKQALPPGIDLFQSEYKNADLQALLVEKQCISMRSI